MALLKPYATFEVECSGCHGACQVVIWNGIAGWEFAPQPELTSQEDAAIATIKCSPDMTVEWARFAQDEAPHFLDRLILWAKDSATYEALLALASNPTAVHESQPHVKH